MRTRSRWRWIEGEVGPTDVHFVLRWPSGRWPGYREQAAIARVGRSPAMAEVFVVEWLTPATLAPHHLAEAHADAVDEVQGYLVDRDEDDPWAYARDHCSTAANLYSCVRWTYVDPRGRAGDSEAPSPATGRSIPVACPRCSSPTQLAPARHFVCSACGWHD